MGKNPTAGESGAAQRGDPPRRVLLASLAGTTIEFFDFYIFATAAVLVFPQLFFSAGDPTTAVLQSFATFAIAFFTRPVGAALFGHFGDRLGRKATLVAALLTMGFSTVAIGFLPTYAAIGVAAPLLLALCRVGQGLGLGGEWGGAVLIATENAPPGKGSWYGMFPQLGAPIGFVLSTGTFLLLTAGLDNAEFFSFGWRIPFIASAVLVGVGLYVRLKISETPAFRRAAASDALVAVPMMAVLVGQKRNVMLGCFVALATFVLFYLMTVFSLNWGTARLGYGRTEFLWYQMLGVVFFGAAIPFSAWLADRWGRRRILMLATVAIGAFGFLMAPLLDLGGAAGAASFCVLGLALMGLTYGPLGAAIAEIFPTELRYTGASLAFNLAGIFGASLAPYLATWLAGEYGLAYVGYYLTAAAALTFAAIVMTAGKMESAGAGVVTVPAPDEM
jgi:metabolite-proton symporter